MKGQRFVKLGILLIVIGFVVTSYETVNGLVKGYLNDVNLSKEVVASINLKYDIFSNDIDRYKNNLNNYCRYDINESVKKEKCNIFKKNFKNSIDSYHKAINEYNRIVSLYNSRILRHKKSLDSYVSPIDKELNKLYKEL